MRRLSDREILEVWEQGQDLGSAEQAVVMLAGARPDESPRRLASLPAGRRDGLLLRLRKATLGKQLPAVAECPGCGQSTRFAVDLDDVLAAEQPGAADGPFDFTADAFVLRCRLPDSRDLAAAAATGHFEPARRLLAQRCVLEARCREREILPTELPDSVLEALGEAVEARDPMALVPLDLTCGACGQRWFPLFDVVEIFWRELAARAESLLGDVQTLALTYGWSEADIFTMPAARRRFYLEHAPARPSPSETD